MPCGGIYPMGVQEEEACYHCSGANPDAFCEEWDCFLHRSCIDAFLLTAEGKVVLEHGHEVIRA